MWRNTSQFSFRPLLVTHHFLISCLHSFLKAASVANVAYSNVTYMHQYLPPNAAFWAS